MTNSLRDQLLGLGFKTAPKPERKPEHKPATGKPSHGEPRRGGKPAHADNRPPRNPATHRQGSHKPGTQKPQSQKPRTREDIESLLEEVESRIFKPFKGLWASPTMARVRELLSTHPSLSLPSS